MAKVLLKLTSAKSATSNCSDSSKRKDFRGTGLDHTFIEVCCDNCGAKYVVFATDPDVPELHRVCDTCFMPMCARNDYYYWRLEWRKSFRQF